MKTVACDSLSNSDNDPRVPRPHTDLSSVSGAELSEPCKKALLLWLQWNAAYEKVAEQMFQTGQDQQALQSMMDQMDRLRKDAVELSRDLLD